MQLQYQNGMNVKKNPAINFYASSLCENNTRGVRQIFHAWYNKSLKKILLWENNSDISTPFFYRNCCNVSVFNSALGDFPGFITAIFHISCTSVELHNKILENMGHWKWLYIRTYCLVILPSFASSNLSLLFL